MATYNIFNLLARKVEMCKCLKVIREREAPFLFKVVSRFSDQIYVQMYHGGPSQTLLQRGSFFSFIQAFNPQQGLQLSVRRENTYKLKKALADRQMLMNGLTIY